MYLPITNDIVIIDRGTYPYRMNQTVRLFDNSTDTGLIYRVASTEPLSFSIDSIIRHPVISMDHKFRFVVSNDSLSQYATCALRSLTLVFYCDVVDGGLSTEFYGQYFCPVLITPQFYTEEQRLYSSPNLTIPPVNKSNQPIDLLSSQNRMGCTGIRLVLRDTTNHHRLYFFVQPIQTQYLTRFDLLPSSPPPLVLRFAVLSFSNEGVVPLNFTGSAITQSQMSCYEMTILNLILPNRVINSVEGLLTSAYPYVFLEISNETLPSGHNRSIIYSNNPFAVKATFVCSISDVNNPEFTRFIKISSDGAKQILKFSPYDNLRIRISLPNGQTFQTEETDFLVPNEPDPRLQIQIVAQFKKL